MLNQNHIDIVCLSEHSMSEEEIKTVYMSNYKLSSQFSRKHFIRGGVAIFTNSGIETKEMENIRSLSAEKDLEMCCIVLNKFKVFVLSIVRPITL